MKTMFIGNLPPDTQESDLEELCSKYGTVRGIRISTDVFSGKCRGFATVDMEGHEAREAIGGLNGTQFKGKALRVNEERERLKGKRGAKKGRRGR